MSHEQRKLRRVPRLGFLAASIGALLATGSLSGTAWSQEQDEEETRAPQQNDEIIVTGTRIRRDDFSAANATSVVTGDDMQNLGVFSVADMVNQLPNNIGSVTPEATADSPFYLGASIANLRGLNTAYGVRTLTLLDSRRMTPNNNGGGVDMNFIPSALVDRIETVTGGASATYGADAMAGVVNVIIDDNIDNMRLSLEFGSTSEGDGDEYNLSFGTGAQFLEGRARLTIGLDSSRVDAIEDCTSRDYCRRGLGLLRNGRAGGFDIPYILNPNGQPPGAGRGTDIFFPGQPEWLPTEGHRFTVTPTGVLEGEGVATPGDLNNPADPNWDLGWYQFNDAGNDVVPYLNNLTPEQLAAVNSVGVQVGAFAAGSAWATPYGGGKGIYEDQPIRPKQKRDNLFTRFTYDLEGGITLSADLTYGETEAETLQNMSRGNMQGFCVQPQNAYIQPGVASDLMRAVLLGRSVPGHSHETAGTFVFANTTGACFQAPYLGGSFNERPDGTPVAKFDFPAGVEVYKDFSDQVDRRNTNKSNAKSLSISATGPLFDGGSWDWDIFAQFGKTENRQTLSGWRAARRWDMALDSVIDGDGVAKCGINATNLPYTDTRPGDFDQPRQEVQYGDYVRDKWEYYLFAANADHLTQAERDQVFNQLAEGCVPFNPFGNQPFTQEQIDYIFPTLFEGTDNDQTGLSVSFSGDAWRGIGNAGAMGMAAGLDWRENDTQNIADPNRFLGADFNFVGNSSSGQFDRIYGDNWFGRTTTREAWVEFDLPLLRDRFLADTLGINTSFRRTRSHEQRISGLENVTTPNTENETDSWKATLSWQPVPVMRMRATRSADTRAPSARELYATNSYATESGGQTEIRNPWRFDAPDLNFNSEDGDQYIRIQGGNANLDAERSITETLGFVFQPTQAIPGLQISVDYYETTIKGGIERIGVNQTLSLCEDEIGAWQNGPVPAVPPSEWRFCNQIEFGDPRNIDPNGVQEFFVEGAREAPFGFGQGDLIVDAEGNPVQDGMPNPYYPYTNIVTIAESTINTEDFWSRGVDYSISYFTQLRGGASISARALITRFLEQSVFDDTLGRIDVSGQTGGNNITNSFGSFSNNYSPTPRIRGNLFMTYQKNALRVTAQAQYVGSGKLNIQNGWIGPGDSTYFTRHFLGAPFPQMPATCVNLGLPETCQNPVLVTYDPHRDRTVTSNDLPSWTTLNLNFNYDFGSSRAFSLDRFESLSLFLNIDNVGDRVPTFFSGTGAGGINTALFSGMGRSYRLGVRMEF